MKRVYKYGLMILIALVIISALGLMIANPFQDKTEYSSSGVLEKIKSIRELNTVEMYFNEIIDYKNARYFKDIQIPFTEKTFIFTVTAKVKAGTDLSNLTEEDIQYQDGLLTITLDSPKITSKEILSYKAYHEKDGLFNEVTNEDTIAALEQFKLDLEEQALENGILDKAREHAEEFLEGFFLANGFEEVEIKWKG